MKHSSLVEHLNGGLYSLKILHDKTIFTFIIKQQNQEMLDFHLRADNVHNSPKMSASNMHSHGWLLFGLGPPTQTHFSHQTVSRQMRRPVSSFQLLLLSSCGPDEVLVTLGLEKGNWIFWKPVPNCPIMRISSFYQSMFFTFWQLCVAKQPSNSSTPLETFSKKMSW